MSKTEVREITRGCQFRPITKVFNLYWHYVPGFDGKPQCKQGDCPLCANIGGIQANYLFGAIDRHDNRYVIMRVDANMMTKINYAKRAENADLRHDGFDVLVNRASGKLAPQIVDIRPLTLDEQALRGEFMSVQEIKDIAAASPMSCLNSICKRYLDSLKLPAKTKATNPFDQLIYQSTTILSQPIRFRR
jgi:hypothetical protein